MARDDTERIVMDDSVGEPESRKTGGMSRDQRRLLYCLYAVAQILGVNSIILILVWSIKYTGGFGWSNPDTRFNWHPLFMITGFIVLSGNGIMTFRVFQDERKVILKRVHAILNGLALVCISCGTFVAFSIHHAQNDPNAYTIHSWVGLLCVSLFTLQFTAGLAIFLFPGASAGIRKLSLPVHAFNGMATMALSVSAVISGLMENAEYVLNGKGDLPVYSSLSGAALTNNLLGMSVVGFVFFVGFIVTRTEFKRKSTS
ncbi:Plasma membrane ascorbate-dependent reductase CYBRD1 [Halotydeus destructor]|nr:Plasma membrane ascorbate-dependent reductase CYBRD1 [Halotydeus destructor]